MKTTLLAVLIITVCYDHVLAQNNTPQIINTTHNTSVTNKVITASGITGDVATCCKLSDGAIATDKLANDLITTNKLIDGVDASNKLAEDIIASLKIAELNQKAETTRHTEKVEHCSYACCEQHLLPNMQQLHKPRPKNSKRKGRLQL
jgi:hypothetical protein